MENYQRPHYTEIVCLLTSPFGKGISQVLLCLKTVISIQFHLKGTKNPLRDQSKLVFTQSVYRMSDILL